MTRTCQNCSTDISRYAKGYVFCTDCDKMLTEVDNGWRFMRCELCGNKLAGQPRRFCAGCELKDCDEPTCPEYGLRGHLHRDHDPDHLPADCECHKLARSSSVFPVSAPYCECACHDHKVLGYIGVRALDGTAIAKCGRCGNRVYWSAWNQKWEVDR